jgi:hypothetical protein
MGNQVGEASTRAGYLHRAIRNADALPGVIWGGCGFGFALTGRGADDRRLAAQLAAVAGGICAGWWLFNWATS